MARKKPTVNLAQSVRPHAGDLEKLFTTDEDVEQSSGLQLVALRLTAIEPDPDQPRSTFSDEGLRELAESIRQDGVIQPIEVTEGPDGRYMIVHGERRWRAAQLAGLDTVPAVVRRRAYDDVTRFVRQVVENIQREDLNDVDRAAALLRLRQLMQEELDSARVEGVGAGEPWGGRISWAKVGGRLGYSRQRIHQLIQLLDLPDEIKDAVREGAMSERDTRIYQGLTLVQQRALHRARMAGDLESSEVKQVARLLREAPETTVSQATRLLRQSAAEQPARPLLPPAPPDTAPPAIDYSGTTTDGLTPDRVSRPTNFDRLGWIRGHLARIDRHGLTTAERKEMIRLLTLIQNDVASLVAALVNAADDDRPPGTT
jgi:ParB family chromosome partitioning protein